MKNRCDDVHDDDAADRDDGDGADARADTGYTATVRNSWNSVKRYVAASAEKMPAEHYSFKPTPEVRSFGELIGHLANEHYLLCAPLKGEANPMAKVDFEKTDREGRPGQGNQRLERLLRRGLRRREGRSENDRAVLGDASRHAVPRDAAQRHARQRALRQHDHLPAHERHRAALVDADAMRHWSPDALTIDGAAAVARRRRGRRRASRRRASSSRRRAPPPDPRRARATRLLVIAPHPDDEVLGAGGLMQRVHATGGAVRVVYLTDGEGYPEGVMESDHTLKPTVQGLSRLRQATPARGAQRTGPPRAARRVPDVSSAIRTAGSAS